MQRNADVGGMESGGIKASRYQSFGSLAQRVVANPANLAGSVAHADQTDECHCESHLVLIEHMNNISGVV